MHGTFKKVLLWLALIHDAEFCLIKQNLNTGYICTVES